MRQLGRERGRAMRGHDEIRSLLGMRLGSVVGIADSRDAVTRRACSTLLHDMSQLMRQQMPAGARMRIVFTPTEHNVASDRVRSRVHVAR